MAKIRRNQLCPCGSGLKHKRCCGRHPEIPRSRFDDPEHQRAFEQHLRRIEAERAQREAQQGLGKGIISATLQEHRIVCVGNTVYTSKEWKTFHDFLQYFLIEQLGRDWFQAEFAKLDANERHPVVVWFSKARENTKLNHKKVGDVYFGPMTGAHRAFLNLAYNIYLIAHHAEPKASAAIVSTFTSRLRSERTDAFIGKLFETYAAAAFLKAGFQLAYEDEADGNSTHVEFVATYPATGKQFSVEVKTRNRSPSEEGQVDEIKRLRVGNKLNRAFTKDAAHTRVVIIEVNVPDVPTSIDSGWPHAALEQIRAVENQPQPDGSPKPSAYVIVTNHAFHNNLDMTDANAQVMAAGCQFPDFGPDAQFSRLKDLLESQSRHREMLALIDSMRLHYDIPQTFDGENPEFAFGGYDEPRLRFGELYVIPDQDGSAVTGRLYEALVN